MIKVQISPIWRGTKVQSVTQKRMEHASIRIGAIQAYAIGTSVQDAKAKAEQIASIHVYALNLDEIAKRGNPLTVGIPRHYRLAQGA